MKIITVTSEAQFNEAFSIREIVFINEQNVPPELEKDEFEEAAIHFIGYLGDEPIATGRVRFVDDYGKLERIAVLKEHRGQSYGTQIIRQMERKIRQKNFKKALLHAQTHAIDFYEKLGYDVMSDEFMDAGIPHVAMEKKLIN